MKTNAFQKSQLVISISIDDSIGAAFGNRGKQPIAPQVLLALIHMWSVTTSLYAMSSRATKPASCVLSSRHYLNGMAAKYLFWGKGTPPALMHTPTMPPQSMYSRVLATQKTKNYIKKKEYFWVLGKLMEGVLCWGSAGARVFWPASNKPTVGQSLASCI